MYRHCFRLSAHLRALIRPQRFCVTFINRFNALRLASSVSLITSCGLKHVRSFDCKNSWNIVYTAFSPNLRIPSSTITFLWSTASSDMCAIITPTNFRKRPLIMIFVFFFFLRLWLIFGFCIARMFFALCCVRDLCYLVAYSQYLGVVLALYEMHCYGCQ